MSPTASPSTPVAARSLPSAPWPPSWSDEARRALQPRHAVLAALLMTYIWRFHDLTPLISTFRIAAVATVLSWAFLLLRPRLGVLRQALALPSVLCFLLWSVWAGVTVPMALSPDLAWAAWFDGHFKSVTMFLFMVTCLDRMEVVRFSVAVQVFAGTVLALFYAKSGFSQDFTPVPSYDRNDFALAMNIVLPLTLYLGLAAKSRNERIVLWGAAGVITACIMMSQSRGGFLTLACIMMYTLVRLKRVKLRYRLLPPLLIAGSLFFLPQEIQDRLGTLLNPTEDYNYDHEVGRIAIWKRGMRYLGDYPVAGVGIENFPVAEARLSGLARNSGRQLGAVTHNSFVQALVETGVVGFAFYIGMIGFAVWRLARIRKRFARFTRDAKANDLVLAADFTMVALLGFCVGGFFLSMAYSPMIFSLVALSAGLELSARRWVKRRRKLARHYRAHGMAVRLQPGGSA